jgi:hypothetical protein
MNTTEHRVQARAGRSTPASPPQPCRLHLYAMHHAMPTIISGGAGCQAQTANNQSCADPGCALLHPCTAVYNEQGLLQPLIMTGCMALCAMYQRTPLLCTVTCGMHPLTCQYALLAHMKQTDAKLLLRSTK